MIIKRARKAFTVVEMVVVLALMGIIGIMMAQSFDSTSDRANQSVIGSAAQSAAREVSNELTRAVTAAHPATVCIDDEGACLNWTIDPEASAMLHASDKCMIFYAYARAGDEAGTELSADSVLRHPELVVARVGTSADAKTSPTVVIDRYTQTTDSTPADINAGTLCASSTGSFRSSHVNYPLVSNSIFSYRDSDAQTLTLPMDAETLARVAVVNVDAQFEAGRDKVLNMNLSLVIPTAGYEGVN